MKTLIRLAGGLLGGVIGFQLGALPPPWLPDLVTRIAIGVIGALLGWLIAPYLWKQFTRGMDWVLQRLAHLSLRDLALGAGGLIVGLVIAYLLGFLLLQIPYVGRYLALASALVFGYLGIHVAIQRREEMSRYLPRVDGRWSGAASNSGMPKILDTSAIIDGRIADLCGTGFLEGPLLVPRAVLEELQRIADSPDAIRRGRGRRGLDMLNRLRKEFDAVQIVEDPGIGGEVDGRLVAYAKSVDGWIITNDFNLNKVAELQGVRVLNINKLAQALRPVLLPGEVLSLQIIKDGKEPGQGVGYLEDGTMVVVENARRLVGENAEVVVTSVLQTVAGRMIFARPRAETPTGSSTSPRR